MAGGYTLEQVQQTYKPRDAWWTVFLVDPLASRLVKVTANRTSITPNQLTVGALLLGFVSAGLFWQADTWALVLGAVIYHVSFVLDCMDGKVARLKGTGSILGSWLDYIFDRIRVFVCALALFFGQYRETNDAWYLLLACVVIFLDMLRYMNALQIAKVRRAMNDEIIRTAQERGIDPTEWLLPASVEEADEAATDRVGLRGPDEPLTPVNEVVAMEVTDPQTEAARRIATTELQASFSQRFSWFGGMRDALRRRRIRPHLFSGIEFQMFVFIIGPLTTLVFATTVLSAVLLLVFEFAIVYKLVLSARDLDSLLDRLRTEPPTPK